MLFVAGLGAFAIYRGHYGPVSRFPSSLPLLTEERRPLTGEVETSWPLPPGGGQVRHVLQGPGLYGVLTVVAPAGDGARQFDVRVRDWYDNRAITTLYFRSGDAFEVDVPVGAYRLLFAEGEGRQGYDRLFGRATTFTEGVQPVVIAPPDGTATGVRLMLEPWQVGNFHRLPTAAVL